MKKSLMAIYLSFGLIIIAIVVGAFLLAENRYDVLEENWGIELPEAKNVEDLVSTNSSFSEDAEWFTLYTYEEPIDIAEQGFTKLTADNVAKANEHITSFVQETIEIHHEDLELANVFNNNMVEAEEGDYYYYQSLTDNHDLLILLYKSGSNKLYHYEWHK